MIHRTAVLTVFTFLSLVTLSLGVSQAQTPAALELFETNARPVFVQKCQPCHSAKLRSGGFDLSSPEGIKEAAAMGIFGKQSDPAKSPIIRALSYENQIKMPPQGKLPAGNDCCRQGVVSRRRADSRRHAIRRQFPGWNRRPSGRVARRHHRRRQKFLGVQAAIADAPPPDPASRRTGRSTRIDQFILANLEKNGLKPAPQADKTTLLRRATFDLTGLPPTEKELARLPGRQVAQRL